MYISYIIFNRNSVNNRSCSITFKIKTCFKNVEKLLEIKTGYIKLCSIPVYLTVTVFFNEIVLPNKIQSRAQYTVRPIVKAKPIWILFALFRVISELFQPKNIKCCHQFENFDSKKCKRELYIIYYIN